MRLISRRRLSSVWVAALAPTVLSGCSAEGRKVVALGLPELHAQKTLLVTSQSFDAQRPLSRLFSSYGSNIEPDIRWARSPDARSYAIIVEDPDAISATPFVHWVAYNIPPVEKGAEQSVGGEHRDDSADGIQGKNDSGSVGYYGPHPPIGDEPHHYHFEVFALDSTLALSSGADRNALAAAMKGHVMASGELVATYEER